MCERTMNKKIYKSALLTLTNWKGRSPSQIPDCAFSILFIFFIATFNSTDNMLNAKIKQTNTKIKPKTPKMNIAFISTCIYKDQSFQVLGRGKENIANILGCQKVRSGSSIRCYKNPNKLLGQTSNFNTTLAY